jgi:hypothetical protein
MKRNTQNSIIKWAIIAVISTALIVIVFFVIAATIFNHKTNVKRDAIANKYSSVNLPSYLRFTSKIAEGDGVDSEPYWYYYYTTPKDTQTTSNDIQTILKQSGYTIGGVETAADLAIYDPGTDYEFDATNSTQGLKLIIEVSQSKNVTVTVNKED